MRTLIVSNSHHNIMNGIRNATDGVLWNEQMKSAFDTFYEFRPERVFVQKEDMTDNLYKCILKYQPQVWTDANIGLPVNSFEFKAGFDDFSYKPSTYDGATYIGTYKPELDWLNHVDVKIFGSKWPSPKCLGMCLQHTENNFLGGITISFGTDKYEDRPYKSLGVGGKCLSKYSDYLYNTFGESLEYFTNFDEFLKGFEKIKRTKYKPFDISKFTYKFYVEAA